MCLLDRYQKITSGRYDKSKLEFSPPLSDFVDQLLQKNPAKRLGGAKGGIGDVLKHKWLGSVDWKGLHRGTLSAPIVPEKKTSRAAESAVDPSMDPSLWVSVCLCHILSYLIIVKRRGKSYCYTIEYP